MFRDDLDQKVKDLGGSSLFRNYVKYVMENNIGDNQVSSFNHFVENVDDPNGDDWARRGTQIEESLWEGDLAKLENMNHLDDQVTNILENITDRNFK